MRQILSIVVVLILGGCSRSDMLEKVSTPADRKLAEQLISDIRSGRDQAVSEQLVPELRGQIAQALPQMRRVLPDGKVRLVDAGFNTTKIMGQPNVRNSYLAYAADDATRHGVIRVGIRQDGLARGVTDLYITPLIAPVEALTAFSLSGKSVPHFLFLALAVLSFSTIILAITLMVRAKGLERFPSRLNRGGFPSV